MPGQETERYLQLMFALEGNGTIKFSGVNMSAHLLKAKSWILGVLAATTILLIQPALTAAAKGQADSAREELEERLSSLESLELEQYAGIEGAWGHEYDCNHH